MKSEISIFIFVIHFCDQEIEGQTYKYLILYTFVRQKDLTYCCQKRITNEDIKIDVLRFLNFVFGCQ